MSEEVTYPCPGDRTAQELMTARMEAQLREKYREQERIAEEKVRRQGADVTIKPTIEECIEAYSDGRHQL